MADHLKPEELDALEQIYFAMKEAPGNPFHHPTFDCDNKDGEIIFSVGNGNDEYPEYVLRSRDIKKTGD